MTSFRLLCLAVLSSSCSLHQTAASSTYASTGGNFPPPPPPPPRDVLSLMSKSSDVKEDAKGVVDEHVPDLHKDDADALKQSKDDDDQTGGDVKRIQDADQQLLIEDKPSAESGTTWPAPKSHDVNPQWGQNSAQQSLWDADAPSSSDNGSEHQNQQQNQQHYPNQSWGNEQTASQYPDQYNYGHQQWQQSQYDAQQYQQTPQYQQQQYPSNQYHQQQQQQYPSQYMRSPPQQQRQLALRPSPTVASAKTSASRIFSLAVRKIQTGIDTVSETLDVDKVTSSVSSLTSKIGSTVGGAVAGGVGSVVGLSGSGRAGGMPNSAQGPQRRPIPEQGRGMAMSGPRQMPPQRMTGPYPRLVARQKETFAPPVSDLYSLGQQNRSMHGDGGDDIREDNALEMEPPMLHDDDHSEAETDKEDELIPKMNSPGESGTQLRQQMSRPGMPTGVRQPNSMQYSAQTNQNRNQRQGGRAPPLKAPTQRRYDTYDDDDESSSIGSKMKSAIGSIPVPRVPNPFKSSGSYDDGVWSDYETSDKATGGFFGRSSSAASATVSSPQPRRASSRSSNAAHVPGTVISLLNKRDTLLSSNSARKCASIGRTQAILDAGQLTFVVFALREMLPLFFNALSSHRASSSELRMAIVSTIISALDGWAPFALVAAFLISASESAWIKPALRAASVEAASESASEAAYSQLYLRLMSSLPMKKSFPSKVVGKSAEAHALAVSSTSRLRFFVTIAVAYVLLSTVAILQPAGAAVATLVMSIIHLNEWNERPIDWKLVLKGAKTVGVDLVGSLHTLFDAEMGVIRKQPLRVVVVIALLTVLVSVSYLPSFEKRRKNNPTGMDDDEEEEDDVITSLWSNIGASSASRLGLLSSPRAVEGALAQFTKLRPDRAVAAGLSLPGSRSQLTRKKRKQQRASLTYLRTFQPLLREVAYAIPVLLLLSTPLAVYAYVWIKSQSEDDGSTLSIKDISQTGWMSLFDMAALLFMTNVQVARSTHYAIRAANARLGTSLSSFFQTLATTVSELNKIQEESSSGADFQAMLTASPNKGLVIKDLWAAHATRKAWAVKGANIQCRNGEVVFVIGTDGAGKSRLLTAISEHVFAPPKSARTTTFVRGSVNVAGVDLSKWDRKQLQRRVGVYLNDVRTVSDYASLMTGCTLEEILEPVSLVAGSRINAKEKNAMVVAMKITGLGSKLSSRLPSKLSTVVSANEDELKPSPLRPPAYPLSPSDWSRVLLTRVLAQLIAGNDNQISSPNTVTKSMIGSILLLDDATSTMSEVDEANFITALRSTGAAVILTTNRWAAGRYADRIVVVDNGSVVESGTHADLINLGPERSLYARQWNAMSSV
eukprot:g12504.t1 g12504   contig6:2043684-2047802(-)